MQAPSRRTFDGLLFAACAETLKPSVVGIHISMLLGVSICRLIGLSDWFVWLIAPIFVVIQAVLMPLLKMAHGVGLTSNVFVVCIMAMPGIVRSNAGVSAIRQLRSREKAPVPAIKQGHLPQD